MSALQLKLKSSLCFVIVFLFLPCSWINVFPSQKTICIQKNSRNLRHPSMEYGVSDCFLPIRFFLVFCLTFDWPDNREPQYADPQITVMDVRQNQSQNNESTSRSTATPTASPLPRTVPQEEKRVWLPRINHANDSVKKIHWTCRLPREETEGEKEITDVGLVWLYETAIVWRCLLVKRITLND